MEKKTEFNKEWAKVSSKLPRNSSNLYELSLENMELIAYGFFQSGIICAMNENIERLKKSNL